MPYKHLTLFILLITLNTYSQRYEFDTFVEYDFFSDQDSKPQKTFEFTYSKDNSYILSILEKDKKTFTLTFLNAKGEKATRTISKKDFFETENIIVNCSSLEKQNISYRENTTKDYYYLQLNDTVISRDTLQHFLVKSDINSIHGERHYIIQKDTEFHLPNITPGTIPYFKWKKASILPKGLFKESFIKKDDEIIEKMMMLKYSKIKKILVLERGC